MSQHHIDSIVSSIAVVASDMKQKFGDKQAVVYTELCNLFQVTLITHRKKLGGRYHLIVRALQDLLRCLFIPYTDTENNLSKASREDLDVSHATIYARLLTTLCDPTVSAVSRHRHRPGEGLNDATQKARSIAGQHVQYVVEEYCVCQLSGRLLPEMRSALNPGLYAMLAVIPQEVMRNLNGAMSSSSRSIFRASYEDYKRRGR